MKDIERAEKWHLSFLSLTNQSQDLHSSFSGLLRSTNPAVATFAFPEKRIERSSGGSCSQVTTVHLEGCIDVCNKVLTHQNSFQIHKYAPDGRARGQVCLDKIS